MILLILKIFDPNNIEIDEKSLKKCEWILCSTTNESKEKSKNMRRNCGVKSEI